MKHTKTLLTLGISAALTAHALAADAESEIERLTVTSDFRQQSLLSFAASTSIIDQSLIQVRQAQHLEEVLNLAPNVNFASGASRGRFVQIRGIGERSQFAEPINPSVGFVVDDVDLSGTVGVATLFDVEQVEILRGPQPTEFGASALAGVIKIKTTEADGEQSGRFKASIAEQNTWELGAAYGDQITEKLFYRVSAQQYKSDGFIDNIFLNRPTDTLDEFTSRVKLKYLASESVSLDFSYQYFDIDNGYDAFSLDNDRNTRSDEPGFDSQETHAFSAKVTSQHQWGNLVAIAALTDSDLGYAYDEDWTFVGFDPFEYSSTDHYLRERNSSSFELRALSNDSSRLFNNSTDWVVGVFSKQIEEDLVRQYTFNAADFTSIYEPENTALYLQTETAFSQSLFLSVGLRAENFQINYQDNAGLVESTEDDMVGGKVSLSYRTDNATVYTSIARGYKAGGVNQDQQVSDNARFFDPEYSWNYEIGVKGYFEQGYARVAIFYQDREDAQVSDFDVQQTQNENGAIISDFIDIIGNADAGESKGIEIETGYDVTERLSISVNLGLMESEFGGYTNARGEFIQEQDLAHAPEYSGNITLNYAVTDNLNWRIEMDAKDDFRFSDGHDEISPAYELVNSQLSYSHADWLFTAWVKNLFDEEYFVRGFGGFGNDPRDFYAPGAYFQLGDGRQAGLSVEYQF